MEKLPSTNLEAHESQDHMPSVYAQSGLDASAELVVNAITAPVGLDAFEVPKTTSGEVDASEPMESAVITTSNGHEIENPREKLDVTELRSMLEEYNLGGDTPKSRAEALKSQSKETFATFLSDLNRRIQGSNDTLIHDETMKIGDKETVAPEDRYDLFSSIYDKVRSSSEDISPARIGDALALTTVMLHPFKDGNGRTARMLGYIYRADFNNPEDVEDFDTLAEPRDQARERGGWMINGYVPFMGEGVDQTDPTQVSAYIDRVLREDQEGLYTGPFGEAPIGVKAQPPEVKQ